MDVLIIVLMLTILFWVVETQCRISMEKQLWQGEFYNSCLYTFYNYFSFIVIAISTIIVSINTNWWFVLKMFGWFVLSTGIGITAIKFILNILFQDKDYIYGRILAIIITLVLCAVNVIMWF